MFVSALPDPTCNSEKSANGGNKQILLLLLLLVSNSICGPNIQVPLWTNAPQYLVDLIAVAAQSRYNLRSRNATLLVPANEQCLPTLGDRAFQSAATKLWNSLPAEIRNIQSLTSFKRVLKTYFFKIAF